VWATPSRLSLRARVLALLVDLPVPLRLRSFFVLVPPLERQLAATRCGSLPTEVVDVGAGQVQRVHGKSLLSWSVVALSFDTKV